MAYLSFETAGAQRENRTLRRLPFASPCSGSLRVSRARYPPRGDSDLAWRKAVRSDSFRWSSLGANDSEKCAFLVLSMTPASLEICSHFWKHRGRVSTSGVRSLPDSPAAIWRRNPSLRIPLPQSVAGQTSIAQNWWSRIERISRTTPPGRAQKKGWWSRETLDRRAVDYSDRGSALQLGLGRERANELRRSCCRKCGRPSAGQGYDPWPVFVDGALKVYRMNESEKQEVAVLYIQGERKHIVLTYVSRAQRHSHCELTWFDNK